jgi:hypothetical protein
MSGILCPYFEWRRRHQIIDELLQQSNEIAGAKKEKRPADDKNKD